jgi:hypothetical protein
MRSHSTRGRFLSTLAALAVAIGFLSVANMAEAATPAPAWRISQATLPTSLEPGSEANLFVTESRINAPKIHLIAVNVGAARATGVTITDTLPVGLTVPEGLAPEWWSLQAEIPPPGGGSVGETSGPCAVSGQVVTCTLNEEVAPGTSVHVYIPLKVASIATTALANEVSLVSPGTSGLTKEFPTVVGGAPPRFDFAPGSEGLFAGAFDQGGGVPEAGSHPYILEVSENTTSKLVGAGTPFAQGAPSERLRTVEFQVPPGVVVDPQAMPRCKRADFEQGEGTCPVDTQVGVVTLSLSSTNLENTTVPLFNIQPQPTKPAELGFSVTGASIYIQGGIDGNFNVTARSAEILSRLPIANVTLQLWGNPTDETHDRFRSTNLSLCNKLGGCESTCQHGCQIPRSTRPFVTMPSACSASLRYVARETSWQGSTAEREGEFETPSGQPEDVSGCQKLGFSPSVTIGTSSPTASAPTGLQFDLSIPQNENAAGLASATLKKVNVDLPPGMIVNASAAAGLGSCSVAQIGIGTTSPATCPDSSKVGTAEIDTPLLPGPLKGSIYLAEQKNNPFGTLLALYVVVEGEGVVVKLPGRVDLNGQTGQLNATFDNNPQLPFEDLSVSFNGGQRATLVTPAACGVFQARTELTSWASSTPVVLNSPVSVTQGCSTGGFKPGFEAGTTDPVAGQYSTFSLRVTRRDGEENISRISATLPQGLLANLARVEQCPEADAVSGNCPPASQIGVTTSGVGAGSMPLFIPEPGKAPTAVYLAGPYKGAPYSLVVRVPAQAGPFDLGVIAVRVALNVDPFSAQVTASSDPLPQILEGVPVLYRDVRVEVTKPDFVLNPTSCAPKEIGATFVSTGGASVSSTSRFQAAGCTSLKFKPSLKLSLKGSVTRTGHPAVKAVVTYPKQGQFANIRRAQVNLPHSEFLDQENLTNTCTKPVLLARKCPKTSIYGKAKVWTPLLNQPLQGPVYLVGGFGFKLPALVAELDGQLRILLAGKVDSGPNGGIRNTFEAVPDAPVSRFVLELRGGKKYGLLENSENLCKKPQRGIVRFTGQNGAVEAIHPLIQNHCKKQQGNSK